MERSDTIGAVSAALAKAQATFTAVQKTKTAKIPTKSGSSYSYRYADLGDVWAMCRGPLTDNGLSVVQSPENGGDGSIGIVTMLCHESGEWLSSFLTMRSNDATAQAIGATITYLRRYGLCAMLGIVSDDDIDAQSDQQQSSAPIKGDKKPEPAKPVGSPGLKPEPTREDLIAGLKTLWQREKSLGADQPVADIIDDLDEVTIDRIRELGRNAKARLAKLREAQPA